MIFEAQLAAKVGGCRFFRQKRIGTALQNRAVDDFRRKATAQAVALFEEGVFDLRTGGAGFLDFKGGCQPRNSASDDGYPHLLNGPVQGNPFFRVQLSAWNSFSLGKGKP